MKNIINSFSPFINRNSNIRTDDIELKQQLIHFEHQNINTQLIKQISIKLERTLFPIFNQNKHTLYLTNIKVQKKALKKVKLKSSIDYKALQELDFNAKLQFPQSTSLVLPSPIRSYKKNINQSRGQKCKDIVQFCNSQIETKRKSPSKIGLCLPKIDKNIQINQSRSSLNSWSMNNSSSLILINK